MKEHSIAWLPINPAVGFVSALGATQSIHLPIFLSGKDLDVFKAAGGINFNPMTLTFGILLGISDEAPGVDFEYSSQHFRKAFELLAKEFDMPDEEILVLSATARIRDEFGSELSGRMLENALSYYPQSAKIRSDCIMDMWVAAQERAEPDHLPVFAKIVESLKLLEVSGNPENIRKALSYIATVAFSEVEPESLDDFCRANFVLADFDWIESEKHQIERYKATGQFSWKLLSM
jgi:hypothetical protein